MTKYLGFRGAIGQNKDIYEKCYVKMLRDFKANTNR